MNKKSALAFLPALLFASGCVLGPYNGLSPGNVTLTWTFAGQSCAAVPNVARVVVVVPGEVLGNDGNYPCSTNGYSGILLQNFAPGTYNFSADAYGYSNEHLYTASGSFNVDGDVLVPIDLAPAGVARANLIWRFPANSQSSSPSCGQAGASGITDVYASFDSGSLVHYTCDQGFSGSGAQTPPLDPGTHTVSLTATDSNGYSFYALDSSLTLTAGTPSTEQFQFNWSVGGTAVGWQFSNNGGASTFTDCNAAGVSTVHVNFQDVSSGQYLYGTQNDPNTWDSQSCASHSAYYYLHPGTYRVYMVAAPYDSANVASIPTLTITAGAFADPNAPVPVTLSR